jgi:hypothetical protein
MYSCANARYNYDTVVMSVRLTSTAYAAFSFMNVVNRVLVEVQILSRHAVYR